MVLSHPTQYYSPWFRHLAATAGLELRVFYLWDFGVTERHDRQFGQAIKWDVDLLSGYAHEFVPNVARDPGTHHFRGLNNPSLRRRLRAWAPSAILLFGYAYRTHLGLLLRPPAPLIFRGDSHLLGAPRPRGLKRLLLRFIYSRCAAFLPVGKANAAYFRHYGVTEIKLFNVPHCVDAAHFSVTPERLEAAKQLRQSLGISANAAVVLFAGKLIQKKRPDLLLAAFIRAAVPDAHLVFSGDGELLPALRTRAAHRDNIHFLPFANQSAMPARYLLGDVFVLPSEGRHETWGLAVNEAMHVGRPVIVSDHVGGHPDLLETGSQELGAGGVSLPAPRSSLLARGWVFPAGDETALATVLHEALTLPRENLADMGQAAARHAAAFNYEVASAGLLTALKFVIPTSSPSCMATSPNV